MIKKILVVVVLLNVFFLNAQTAISGSIDLDREVLPQKIYLSQIAIEDIPNYNKAIPVATSLIDENGFFQFKKSLISNKDAIYRLHVNRFEKALKITLQVDHLFVFSNRDSIHFKKSKILFSEYTTTNLADREWQKLRKFENQLRKTDSIKEDSLSKGYVGSLKTYTKDSLEILMVKLIGVKQLDNKELLEKDITKNADYYFALLAELKESDIQRSEYLFLENKLAFLTTEVAENKYASSMILNILFGLAIAGLLFVVFRLMRRKSQLVVADLSKQEKNIQGLILDGKSNKEIASELFISLSTVKTHITNIYGKLKVSSRQELAQKMQNSQGTST